MGFKPSYIGQQMTYVPGWTPPPPGRGGANSSCPTEAERYGSVTPFMDRNRRKDAPRRNYVVQPGGAIAYFETPEAMEEALTGVAPPGVEEPVPTYRRVDRIENTSNAQMKSQMSSGNRPIQAGIPKLVDRTTPESVAIRGPFTYLDTDPLVWRARHDRV